MAAKLSLSHYDQLAVACFSCIAGCFCCVVYSKLSGYKSSSGKPGEEFENGMRSRESGVDSRESGVGSVVIVGIAD